MQFALEWINSFTNHFTGEVQASPAYEDILCECTETKAAQSFPEPTLTDTSKVSPWLVRIFFVEQPGKEHCLWKVSFFAVSPNR